MIEYLLHTNMSITHKYATYENVLWPNLSYTQKYDILYLHFFVTSISVLLFFQNLDSCTSKYSERFKRERQFLLFLKFWPLHSLYWW